MKKIDNYLKTNIADRFTIFRKSIGKTQLELATELHIYQSTITNIEKANTLPRINYLHYLYENYKLNIQWMVTGKGKMFVQDKKGSKIVAEPSASYGTEEIVERKAQTIEFLKKVLPEISKEKHIEKIAEIILDLEVPVLKHGHFTEHKILLKKHKEWIAEYWEEKKEAKSKLKK